MNKKLLLFFVHSLFVTFANAKEGDSVFFVPKDAFDVVQGANPNGKQLSFTIKRNYSVLSGAQEWQSDAFSNGWHLCSGNNLGRWMPFVDDSRKKPSVVHQYVELYMKGKRVVVITARYYSALKDKNNFNQSDFPENDMQHVAGIFISEPMSDAVKNIFKANCEQDVGDKRNRQVE